MTAVAPHSVATRPFPPVHRPRGGRFLGYLSTTAPRLNFISLPRVRSERPAFELHHPYMLERMRTEAHPHRGWQPLRAAGEMAESSPHPAIGTALNDPGEKPT